jgi:molybdenum cofactor cytidylyltransferase
MIFDDFPLGEADGVILAHSLSLPDGTLKKGRRLGGADLARLRAAGRSHVTGIRLEPDDATEDQAADEIAGAIMGDGLTFGPAVTGRCNLLALARGVVEIDRGRVDALNRFDEAVTVATVAPWELVEPGQMVASVKIIPFAVPQQIVRNCVQSAETGGGKLISVRPLLPQKVAIIVTTLPGKENSGDAFFAVSRARIEELGGDWLSEQRCPHEREPLAAAILEALASECTLLLIAGAAACVDRRDVVPAAIVACGGEIEHFGMPVYPGNLMLLARLGNVPVISLPGCARSAKLNGVDLVLRRLAAGLPVTSADIRTMGTGGLLQGVPKRFHTL